MATDEPLPLHPQSRPQDVEAAQRILEQRRVVVSGHRFQPKLVWSLRPMSESDLVSAVEAGGFAPFKVLYILRLPREVVTWTGAMVGSQYAYLVLVEVRATFAPGQG